MVTLNILARGPTQDIGNIDLLRVPLMHFILMSGRDMQTRRSSRGQKIWLLNLVICKVWLIKWQNGKIQ